jgi:hypothetical protein
VTVYIAGPDGKPMEFASEAEADAYRRAQREAAPPLLQRLRKHHDMVLHWQSRAKRSLDHPRSWPRTETLVDIEKGLRNLVFAMAEDIKVAEREQLEALEPK